MLPLLIAALVSFLPFIAFYLWLKGQKKDDANYQQLCRDSLFQGFWCVLPVTLMSGASYIVLRLTGLQNSHVLLYKALYNFIVLALMEEIAKFLAFWRVMKKSDYPFSWLDLTIMMTIASIGFGLIESVVYAIGSNIPTVLIRGICLPHAGYGFIVGYFYGKGCKTGNPMQKWIGFALAWFMHGLYDFSLSEEFIAINDNLVFIPFLLALFDIVLVILLIRFVRRARKDQAYTEPVLVQKKEEE